MYEYIGSGIKPPEVAPPGQAMGRALQLRSLVQEGQMRDLQMQEAQRGIQEDRQLRDLFRNNPAPSESDIYSTVGAKRGSEIIKAQRDAADAALQMKIHTSTLNAAHAERLGVIASGIKDQPTFEQGIATAIQEGALDPVHGKQLLAAGWNPSTQQEIQAFGAQGYKDVVAAHNDERAKAEEQRKILLFGPQLKEAQTKADAAELNAFAQDADAIANQDEWTAKRNAITNPRLRDSIPAFFSQTAVNQVKTRVVPIEKRPELEIKQSEADWLKDPDRLSKLKTQIDSVIPPSKGPIYAYENNMATQAVAAARNQKDAQAAIKDSADRIGRFEVAQTTAAPVREATAENREFQHGQQSYQFHAGELDRLSKPIVELGARFGRLQDTLAAGSPTADALVAPELLSVMSGGQGSGLRMNEAEISRIVGGRSKWETLKANINQWSLDPSKANSITPEQRQEIRALTDEVGRKIKAKQALVDDARRALAGSNDPMEHRRIIADLNTKVTAVDQPAASGRQYVRTATGRNGHKIGQTADGAWYDVQSGNKL